MPSRSSSPRSSARLHRNPDRREDRPEAEESEAPSPPRRCCLADSRSSRLVRRSGQAGPRLRNGAGQRARRRTRAPRQARRRRHEPMALGRRAHRAAATQGLRPRAAARPAQRPQRRRRAAASTRSNRGGGLRRRAAEPFARTQGAGFRGLYDLADPEKSRFMIATGQSGHILLPHYGDLFPLWSAVKSITLTGSEDELKERARRSCPFTLITSAGGFALETSECVRLCRVTRPSANGHGAQRRPARPRAAWTCASSPRRLSDSAATLPYCHTSGAGA